MLKINKFADIFFYKFWITNKNAKSVITVLNWIKTENQYLKIAHKIILLFNLNI